MSESATIALSDRVKALRSCGAAVLDLSGGDPDFDTADHITAAAVAAMQAGFTHYTASRGLPELLQAISLKLRRDNGIDVDPATQIVVTPSSKHALFSSLMAILDPGDELLIPTPSWVSYQAMARLAGAVAVPVELRPEDGFAIDYAGLSKHLTSRTKALVVNTPNNPTGHVLSHSEAEQISRFAAEHELLIVTDEIYEKIVHGDSKHLSLAARPDCAERTLTVNGFSKAYAMPGWRLGYVAGPADLIQAILAVSQHTVACAGSFVQAGGTAALTGPETSISMMAAEYSARADLVVRALNGLPGVTCHSPSGSFYAFADIRGTGVADSVTFAEMLLSEAAVALTPGSAFGPGGEGHVRLSLTASRPELEEALTRIAGFLADHSQFPPRSQELS
ncbi:MAG: pyridoxal phosphate-dependent aminotransferase [Jatrophihabitantaceae bacterium]